MKCPGCGAPAVKTRLDVYRCTAPCGQVHLIVRYRAEEKEAKALKMRVVLEAGPDA